MVRSEWLEGGIVRVLLDRPSSRNAMSVVMWKELGDAIAAVDTEGANVVVIASGVEDIFCPGADIKEFLGLRESSNARRVMRQAMQHTVNMIENCPLPIIAEIDGACVGAGVSIATACDLRIASARSRFGVTAAKLGLVYSTGDLRRLHTVVGSAAAKRLMFTAELFNAEEAHRFGLVDWLSDQAEFASIIERIAAGSSDTHRSTKSIMRKLDNGEPLENNSVEFENAFIMPDAVSRIDAMLKSFAEK